MNNQYDYLIIGAGIFGAVSAYELTKKGYKCLVIEKRSHIAVIPRYNWSPSFKSLKCYNL